MTIYFDETIFTDARSLFTEDDTAISSSNGLKKSHIIVSNRADKYLIEQRHKLTADNKPCRTVESILDDDRICDIVNINPKIPCLGLNIYTMSMSNADIQQVEKFHQIEIVENDDDSVESTTLVNLEEYTPQAIYQLNHKLTAFEAAIMIKYYAINNSGVKITRLLGNAIYRYFVDKRSWFRRSHNGIIQTHYGELILDTELVNTPFLDIAGPSITLL